MGLKEIAGKIGQSTQKALSGKGKIIGGAVAGPLGAGIAAGAATRKIYEAWKNRRIKRKKVGVGALGVAAGGALGGAAAGIRKAFQNKKY